MPNVLTVSNEAYLMFALNKIATWLDDLPAEKWEKTLTDSRKGGRE